jgi:hypothetical protein
MASKPRWACTRCGMWSTRKFSVSRHIRSKHYEGGTIVSFIDYLAGRRSGRYPPSAPPTYQGKTTTTSFVEEVYRATAQELVHRAFNPPNIVNQPEINNTSVQGQRPYFSFWDEIENIFGLGAYLCSNCLVLKPFKICSQENEKGSKREFVVGCDRTWLNNAKGIDDIEAYRTRVRYHIPSFLSRLVNIWTNNRKVLAAIQIPNPSSHSPIELILNGHTGLKKSISLPYDKCKDLTIQSTANRNYSHWAARAIRHKQTCLDDSELSDFLIKLGNDTTFGFLRIKTEAAGTPSAQTYLMAITRNSIDLVT